MARGALDGLFLFLLPFAGYAALLLLRRRYPLALDAWTEGPLARLTIAGLALAVAGTLVMGLIGNHRRGAYVPAHIENGVLVPGRMQ